jgi:nucleotide-binding universal stress UspA family protein
MAKFLVCVDGSGYADNVCVNAAWAAERMGASVDALHVLRTHSDYAAPGNDHTGTIGVDARDELLDALTKVDEDRGRLDQQKGKMILAHAEAFLKDAGVAEVDTLHRRGALAETITDLEDGIDMVFMGKRGEHEVPNSAFLGSNLEQVVRSVHKPVFVASSVVKPIKRFLIAYDGKDSIRKAIDYIAAQPLLKGLECHLLCVEPAEGYIDTSSSVATLEAEGYSVVRASEQTEDHGAAIISYVEGQDIDLLVTGAYSHSRLRSFFLGSTTEALIKACHVPILIFR